MNPTEPPTPTPTQAPAVPPQHTSEPASPPPEPDTSDASEPEEVSRKEAIRGIFSTVGLLLLAPLLALFLIVFVLHSYQVDGPSMETTLQNNDRLIVIKLPRTLARITRHPYIPNRGDVVIFEHPDDSTGDSKHLIKRVIALPGERVVVKDGAITVYNKEHPDGFSPDKTLPYGSVIKETIGDVDLVVGENEVFVVGDNRSNSLDSRYFGPVPASDIVGKLGIRLYPFNKIKIF